MRRWPFAAAGVLTLAVVLAAALVGGSPALAPGTEANATPAATPTAATATPGPQTAVPQKASPVPTRVWFARDQLPPIAAEVPGSDPNTMPGGSTPERRIDSRISALWGARSADVPRAAVNEFARAGRDGSGGTLGLSVRVSGDLATVEFDLGTRGWGVSATAETSALIQQLVYTITEEPGIRRALLKEKGKPRLEVGNAIVDKPLTREDVFGYSFKGSEVGRIAHAGNGQSVRMDGWLLTSAAVEEPAGVLGRLSIEVAEFRPPFEGQGPTPTPAVRPDPAFTAELSPVPATCVRPCAGKWRLVVTLEIAMGRSSPNPTYLDAFGGPIVGMQSAELPSRCSGVGPCTIPVVITLYLEDARPWRVSMEPAEQSRTRINVDVGGRPGWVSRAVAVDTLHADPRSRTVVVRGAARAFEANVSWRKRDATGRVLASGNTTASLGTSAAWGTFRFTVDGESPASCPRPGSLEVFWISPRDGADQDVVSISASIC